MPLYQEEGKYAGEFIVSEGNGTISRENVTVELGQNLEAGTVIGVVTATGNVAQYNNAATDGTEVATGILFESVDATAAATAGVALVRDCEVNDNDLVWPTGITQADKDAGIADLKAANIIVRA